jgi:hypothetical protein
MVMVDVVETALDVPFDDPLVRRIGPIRSGRRLGRADRVPDMLQSVATRPFGTKPVRDGQEARLEDRLQHLQDSGLNDPVPDRRHTQRPELARFSAFGDHHAPDRCRLIRRIAEHRPRISQEAFDPVAALDGPHGHPVRTRRACPAIARDAPPRHPEVTGVGDPVPHVPVGAVRFGPTPPVEFALNVEKPCLVGLINGVHRFFLLLAHLHTSPGPLRHVAGFPGLGLLRDLCPPARSWPDFEGVPPAQADGGHAGVPAFRSKTRGPLGGLLYPRALCPTAMMRGRRSCHCRGMPRPVSVAGPDRAPYIPAAS